MRHNSWSIGSFAIACALLVNATSARAAPETWVAGTGTDAGQCPITAPCKTFAYAHNVTNNGGTLNVLSAGNFGPLTIIKSISIVAQGVEALTSSGAGGAAIKIQAPADRIVSLRGLTLDLLGTANDGIHFLSGAALRVQDCVIRRSRDGIRFAPASGTSELYVADSMIADSSAYGIAVVPAVSASPKVMLDRIRVENSGFSGILFLGDFTTGSINATVRDSVASGNNHDGISGQDVGSDSADSPTKVMVDRSAAVNNGAGIAAYTGARIRIGDSTVSGNGTGLLLSGGVIESYGTNKVNGNDTDGAPTGTPIAMK